jgi:hypothetical protein
MPDARAASKRRRSSTANLAGRLRGRKGRTGEQGIQGPPGVLDPEHVKYFECVTGEIDQIHKDLDIQLRRFAQLQKQMDQLRALLLLPSVAALRAGPARPRKQAT